MKVRTTEIFVPFDITFVVESEDEARALYAIFNHKDNTDLFNDHVDVCNEVKRLLGEKGEFWTTNKNPVISNGVTYDQFYR